MQGGIGASRQVLYVIEHRVQIGVGHVELVPSVKPVTEDVLVAAVSAGAASHEGAGAAGHQLKRSSTCPVVAHTGRDSSRFVTGRPLASDQMPPVDRCSEIMGGFTDRGARTPAATLRHAIQDAFQAGAFTATLAAGASKLAEEGYATAADARRVCVDDQCMAGARIERLLRNTRVGTTEWPS